MSILKKFKTRKKDKIQKACTRIQRIIKPGDVVNQITSYKPYQILLATGIKAIRRYQRHLFGKEANWKHDHCMLYFDRKFTLSVEPPKTIQKPLEKYCLNDISIYRLRNMTLSNNHINTLRSGAEELVGTAYDVGQLLDIAINGLLGLEHTLKIKIFDFGKKKTVCSVGVRSVFEYLYQQKIKKSKDSRDEWLFNTINPLKWSREIVKRFKGTDIDATTPAHFANSDYFDNEFKLIARFKDGKQVYPDSFETLGWKIIGKIKGLLTKKKDKSKN